MPPCASGASNDEDYRAPSDNDLAEDDYNEHECYAIEEDDDQNLAGRVRRLRHSRKQSKRQSITDTDMRQRFEAAQLTSSSRRRAWSPTTS